MMQMADVKLVHVPYKGGGSDDQRSPRRPHSGGSSSACRLQKPCMIPARSESSASPTRAATRNCRMCRPLPKRCRDLKWRPGSRWLLPAGTPASVVQQVSEASAKILKTEAIAKKLGGVGSRRDSQPAGRTRKHHQDRSRGARQPDQGIAAFSLNSTPVIPGRGRKLANPNPEPRIQLIRARAHAARRRPTALDPGKTRDQARPGMTVTRLSCV